MNSSCVIQADGDTDKRLQARRIEELGQGNERMNVSRAYVFHNRVYVFHNGFHSNETSELRKRGEMRGKIWRKCGQCVL